MDPWNENVVGDQALELINSNASTIRLQAGPGTGKTFGLVRRVQRIVHPEGMGVAGKDVLIVAFNRVIAKGLRNDIEERLQGSPIENTPVIRTVHALCLEVIGSPLRLLLPHEREAMLYDLLHDFPELADQYPTHRQAEQSLTEHEAHLSEHLSLWQAATRWLERHKAMLISDLPGLLLDKIHAGDYEGATYEHVIVDEFQDLTPGEQLLFMKLRRPDGSLVVLGDSKQSIYRFRGNDQDGLNKLEELDPAANVTDISMHECHRCPKPMVEAANRLMSLYPPPMEPASNSPASIHVVHWTTPEAEAKGLANHIVSNVLSHPNDRHLVMVTRRHFGYLLRNAIKEMNPDLTIDLSFSESLLETWPVREAFLYLCLFADPDAPTWRAWLGYKSPDENGLFKAPKRNAGAYLRLLEAAGDNITSETIAAVAGEPREAQRGQGGTNLWDRAIRFLELGAKTDIKDDDDSVTVVEKLLDAQWWMAEADDTASLDLDLLRAKCKSIVEELVEGWPESDRQTILGNLAQRLRHLIATREPFETDETHDVQIATLWGAKGVTAEHVYVQGLCEEALPGERRPEYAGTEEQYREEQRRLFYVSITRSRCTLVLSRARRIHRGTARRLGLSVSGYWPFWANLKMCQFLRDIMPTLPKARDGNDWLGDTT